MMGRLTIEKIEPAFDYLMREGKPYDCMFPDDYAVRGTYNDAPYMPKDKAGKHFYCTNKGKYENNEDLPADLAAFALSGSNGSEIKMREVSAEKIPELLFGTEKEQKPGRHLCGSAGSGDLFAARHDDRQR